MLEYYKMILKK